jgi:hypothetical protein
MEDLTCEDWYHLFSGDRTIPLSNEHLQYITTAMDKFAPYTFKPRTFLNCFTPVERTMYHQDVLLYNQETIKSSIDVNRKFFNDVIRKRDSIITQLRQIKSNPPNVIRQPILYRDYLRSHTFLKKDLEQTFTLLMHINQQYKLLYDDYIILDNAIKSFTIWLQEVIRKRTVMYNTLN